MAKAIQEFLIDDVVKKVKVKIAKSRSKAKVLIEVTGSPEETTRKIELIHKALTG